MDFCFLELPSFFKEGNEFRLRKKGVVKPEPLALLLNLGFSDYGLRFQPPPVPLGRASAFPSAYGGEKPPPLV